MAHYRCTCSRSLEKESEESPPRPREERPRRRYEGEICGFQALVTPLTSLLAPDSGKVGLVSFSLRRRNKVVTLQWEPFSGILGASGISFLSVRQTISNLPSFPVSFPLRLECGGKWRVGHLLVDPNVADQIRIYLSLDAKCGSLGDSLFVPGSCVQWIAA